MSEWKECKLGDVAEITSAKRIYYSEYVPNGVPFFRSKEIIERFNRQNTSTELFIKRERYEEIRRKFGAPQEGDILLTSVGTLGIPYQVRKEDEFYFKDGNLTWFRNIDFKAIDRRFLYFWITSVVGQQQLYEASIGSTQPALTIVGLKNIDILLPSILEQRAIAGVLSSLDDKIDLLHRQNKTLEGIAEALWRKMFVEEAKPEWKKGKLGDYGEFKNGINYSRNENGDAEYSILNVRDIVESKYVNVSNFEKVSIDSRKATPYLLAKGDIVIVRSASPGESLIVLEDIDDLIYSGFSIRLRCHDKKHSLFLFQFLQSFKKEMDVFSDGTTLKNINQEILNSIELIAPEKDAVNIFNDRVDCIYDKILLNQRQIQNTSRLRDMLLPKLVTGEVKVHYDQ